jgi:site-specific recombinase XerD
MTPSKNLPANLVTVTTSTGIMATVASSTLDTLGSLYRGCNADNTKETYKAQAKAFSEWCSAVGARMAEGEAVPAELVALHIAHLRERGAKFATVRARVAMLSKWHKVQGLPSPTEVQSVKDAVKGYEASLADAAKLEGAVELLPTKSRALLRKHLVEIVESIDTSTLQGLRDRALLLLGWAGCFRVSELVTLRTEHIAYHAEGMVATAYATKTGKNVEKKISCEEDAGLCPVRALRAWLDAAGITEGLVFRNVTKGGTIGDGLTRFGFAAIVKKRTASLPAGKWSCHSLRSGYATQHYRDGEVAEAYIRKQGGWAATSGVFVGYLQDESEDFSIRRSRIAG